MSAAFFVQTRKEARALLPWTIGVAIASVALAVVARENASSASYHELDVFFVLAYAFGAFAISALSVGQELTHGTLAALLVQPLDRLKVLALKLSVLALALMGLGLLANAMFPDGYLRDTPDLRRLLIWGPVAAGIGLTPLLTVLTRRPLGGVAFSPTIPGLIVTVSERVHPFHKGAEAWTITWYGTLIASALGLATLILKFRTLEVAGDGRGRTWAASASATPADTTPYVPTTRRPWIWLLVRKELRLQQMTLAVSGLYILAAIAVMILSRDPQYMGPTFGAISMIHAYVIPLLAGSVASAEERQMGTLAGQILQPRSRHLQWAIKSVMTIGIALLLAFGLPALLMAIHRPVDTFRAPTDFMLAVGVLCAAAMWVSSISGNTLWALLTSFPVVALAGMGGSFGYIALRGRVSEWIPSLAINAQRWRAMAHDPEFLAAHRAGHAHLDTSLLILRMGLIVIFGWLVLSFASRNHHLLDRRPRTIGKQILITLLLAAAATTAYLVASRIGSNWLENI